MNDIGTIVDECSSWEGHTFDPGTHIRAVNLLRAEDKSRVIDGLRKYCHQHAGDNQWAKESTRVFLLLRILFVPTDAGAQFPTIRIGKPLDTETPSTQDFPLYPLVLTEDVPLLIVSGYMTGGVLEEPTSHLDFCERHCRLRPVALRPPDNPLPLAESLMKSKQWYRKVDQEQDQAMLESQLLRLVRAVYAIPGVDEPSFSSFLKEPGIWLESVNTFSHLNATWSEDRNGYKFPDMGEVRQEITPSQDS